jgi:aerobic carbon-monoxide dehydrogenase small subunit
MSDMRTARTIAFTLNGTPVTADIGPHHNLIEMLQSKFGLTGARESCGQGLCGCCTVSVNGVPVSGCLYLAAFADGAEVTTIEGLGTAQALSPVQQAFIEASAFQCGYCTPGMIMMVTTLLDEQPDPGDDEIRDYLAGNLCRCACYGEILDAVRLAASMRRAAAIDSGGAANDEAPRGTNPPNTPPGVTATALARPGGE